jgi:hypothetical protein
VSCVGWTAADELYSCGYVILIFSSSWPKSSSAIRLLARRPSYGRFKRPNFVIFLEWLRSCQLLFTLYIANVPILFCWKDCELWVWLEPPCFLTTSSKIGCHQWLPHPRYFFGHRVLTPWLKMAAGCWGKLTVRLSTGHLVWWPFLNLNIFHFTEMIT